VGLQLPWDDLVFSAGTLKTLLRASDPWKKGRLLLVQESHIAAWSESFPVPTSANCFALISFALLLHSGMVPQFIKQQYVDEIESLTTKGSMDSLAPGTQATSTDIQQ